MTEQRTYQAKCEECEGKGIFYFTGENSLHESQVCGKCHGVGSHQSTEQSVVCVTCGVETFTCGDPIQCETCTIQSWRGY